MQIKARDADSSRALGPTSSLKESAVHQYCILHFISHVTGTFEIIYNRTIFLSLENTIQLFGFIILINKVTLL